VFATVWQRNLRREPLPVSANVRLRERRLHVAHIPWVSDYEAALERARSEHKFVFLDVFNPG
jgi:hypothetical protein